MLLLEISTDQVSYVHFYCEKKRFFWCCYCKMKLGSASFPPRPLAQVQLISNCAYGLKVCTGKIMRADGSGVDESF